MKPQTEALHILWEDLTCLARVLAESGVPAGVAYDTAQSNGTVMVFRPDDTCAAQLIVTLGPDGRRWRFASYGPDGRESPIGWTEEHDVPLEYAEARLRELWRDPSSASILRPAVIPDAAGLGRGVGAPFTPPAAEPEAAPGDAVWVDVVTALNTLLDDVTSKRLGYASPVPGDESAPEAPTGKVRPDGLHRDGRGSVMPCCAHREPGSAPAKVDVVRLSEGVLDPSRIRRGAITVGDIVCGRIAADDVLLSRITANEIKAGTIGFGSLGDDGKEGSAGVAGG